MNNTLDKTFGFVVKRKREGMHLSQVELARKLGSPQSNVSRLERGQRSPTLRELVTLAQALDTPLSELLKGLEKELGGSGKTHSMVSEASVPYGSVSVFQEAQASEEAVMAQLAAYGVRFLGEPRRPAVFKLSLEETLLSALRFADEPRLFESLPTLVLRNAGRLDWGKLVAGALMLQLQNRLGMVVAAALQLKGEAKDMNKDVWTVLEEVHSKLAQARLDRKEFLGSRPRTHEAMEHLTRRTPGWLKEWHALGAVDHESLSRHLYR